MSETIDYSNKRVLVTGCASGIGRATAELLLSLGAEVHGLDVRDPGVPLHSYVNLDLREQASIDGAVTAIGGCVDALFNCAGLGPAHAALDVLKVNFIGTRHLTERAVELMPPGSAIVSVGSNGGAGWRQRIASLLPLVNTESFDEAVLWCNCHAGASTNAYGLSKEALAVWTVQRSASLIQRGIRVNCSSPGAVQTPMLEEIEKTAPRAAIDAVAQPIGRRSAPLEQAWVLAMLNSRQASYINGVDLPVDGGFVGAMTLRQAQTRG